MELPLIVSLFAGVALVLVVLFLRGGLVEAFRRLRDALGPRARPEPGAKLPVGIAAETEAGS